METITTEAAARLILASNGKIFTASVLTKALLRDNPGVPESRLTPRVFNGRVGVKKAVTGKGRRFTPGPDLIQVGEFHDPAREPNGRFAPDEFDGRYRFIWIDGIRGLRIAGKTYKVVPV